MKATPLWLIVPSALVVLSVRVESKVSREIGCLNALNSFRMVKHFDLSYFRSWGQTCTMHNATYVIRYFKKMPFDLFATSDLFVRKIDHEIHR